MLRVQPARHPNVSGIERILKQTESLDQSAYPHDFHEIIAAVDARLWVAVYDHEVVGSLALFEHTSVQGLVARLAPGAPDADALAVPGDRFGLLGGCYVHPDHRGRGIGRALLGAAIHYSTTEAFDALYAEVGVYDADADARRLLDSQGFDRAYEAAEDYWSGDTCLVCDGACACGGVVYRMTVDSVE